MDQAVIYSRVSTKAQDYTGQTLELQKFATYKELEIVETFEEKASGYDDEIEREQFEKMKDFVIQNNIKNILCWEISRFSRRTYIALKEIEFFSKHNVNIHFKKEEISSLSDNAFNKVLLTLLSSIAQMEKETLKARHRRGMLKGASQGKAHGLGITPYGYEKSEDGRLLELKETSKWVFKMYMWRASGKAIRTIATMLNQKGVYTHHRRIGKKRKLQSGENIEVLWRANSVRKILRSTLYKGIRTYMGEDFKVPILINERLWNKVQKTFEENVGYVTRTKYKYLLKGKIKCGKCGLAYMSRTDKNSSYYFCSGRKDKGILCKNGMFKSQTLDKWVWYMLASMREFYEEYNKQRVEGIDIEEGKNEIKMLKSQIEKSESRRKRKVMAFTEGEMDERTYRNELKKIKDEVKEWENEVKDIEERLVKQNEVVRTLKEGDDFNVRRFLSFNKSREFIEKWVDKITLTNYEGPQIKGTHGNDKIMKVDLYAFGLKNPKSILLSSMSEIIVEL